MIQGVCFGFCKMRKIIKLCSCNTKRIHTVRNAFILSVLCAAESAKLIIIFCFQVMDSKTYSPQSSSRLLDLIDTAIFDFLMDNGDRHHYELAQNNFHNPAVLLIDNGKSLGNPDVDHLDILAPLYQCCM